MTDHVRTQIRDAAVVLVTSLTTTGANVVAGRVWKHDDSLSAVLSVTTNEDERFEDRELGTKQTRLCKLVLEGECRGQSDVDQTLDLIDAETQTAIEADSTFGGLALSSEYANSTKELSGDGDRAAGKITTEYLVLYRVDRTDPTTAIA